MNNHTAQHEFDQTTTPMAIAMVYGSFSRMPDTCPTRKQELLAFGIKLVQMKHSAMSTSTQLSSNNKCGVKSNHSW